ncbi:uncharacterized protein K02A2.6-like [Malaya genurostris]|uniref:uncharacterized protein K02A2.6-like n=1 Tax=Malaya genurostris TaxID=325434 RepID=UPI0026F3BC70|nr:uncharacterized protein K02A2.6-like [Malaya genurostris]
MKAVARSYVFWPSLDVEIAEYVRTCVHCAAAAKSPAHIPPVPWPKSSSPWQRVHVDYAGPIDGEYFLLVVDSYSKWPEIVQTRRITSTATINILRGLFARLGMPEKLVSDNGTQFTSIEFKQFCAENGIDHVTTAPFHPQSNGQIERFVDTLKRAINKIQEGRGSINVALNTFLLTYRSTPNQSAPNGLSPSEVMFGRRLRTCLELLRPPPNCTQESLQHQQVASRSLNKGDAVFVKVYAKNTWKWIPGTVIEKTFANASGTSLQTTTRQLPLSILLDAWELPTTTTTTSTPRSEVTPKAALTSDTVRTPSLSPSFPETSVSQQLLPDMSSTATTTSTSETVTAVTPSVHQPWRSSRVRRPPKRFTPYQRY